MNKVLVVLRSALLSRRGLSRAWPRRRTSIYRSALNVSQARTENDKEETCGDPYWDCCLSYYRGWGPGACGR